MRLSEVSVAIAAPPDSEEIVRLARVSFDPWLTMRTIYGCHGVARYLSATIGRENITGSSHIAAKHEGQLLGWAETKRSGEDLFLSYIAVTPEVRGTGIGGKLLDLAGAGEGRRVLLDVDGKNTLALQWYLRRGFVELTQIGWWEIALPTRPTSTNAQAGGLIEAELCHRVFGFSEFQISVNGTAYRVGQLGEDLFRITEPRLLQEPAMLKTLLEISPTRRLLLIAPLDEAYDTLGEPSLRLSRMISQRGSF